MLYSMSFPEWQLTKRLDALRELNFSVRYHKESNSVDLQKGGCDIFGSAHTEAAKFICDPVYNPKLYNMDYHVGRIVIRLHSEFWYWKMNIYFVDIEEEIAIGIKNFFNDTDCKEQDAWLELKPEELKEKVIKLLQDTFNEDYWMHSTVGHYVAANLSRLPMDTDNVSWKRVHQLLFQEIRK